jgi:hypothetical protein
VTATIDALASPSSMRVDWGVLALDARVGELELTYEAMELSADTRLTTFAYAAVDARGRPRPHDSNDPARKFEQA